MNGLMPVLSQPWAQALAWTLIHFIWQGAAIGLAAWLALRATRLSSNARYGVGVTAMAMMLAAPVVTFTVAMAGQPAAGPLIGEAAGELPPIASSEMTASPAAMNDAAAQAALAARPGDWYLPLVLFTWALGVGMLSARLLGGWFVARRLARRALQPVSADVHALARRVAGRIALDRIVHLFESTAVAVPVTVGWIKPVVLLPASAMSGLSATQIEALLAHELAHIRRHDYLVNLLQSAVETLLFYHPAVWWASRVIRVEREHCCDDVAVGVCDRLTYVSALSDLAAMTAAPRVAMAATNGSLLSRVRRLLGQPSDDGLGASWVPAMLVMLMATAVVPALVAQSSGSGSSSRGDATAVGVRSGVAGGVATGVGPGVAGGVATGVGTGVTGTVAQGIAATGVLDASDRAWSATLDVRDMGWSGSGVNGAVLGGVSQGVRGGAATGVHVADAVTGVVAGQTTARQAEERRRAASQAEQAAEAIARLERELAALAARRHAQEAETDRRLLMTELEAAQRDMQTRQESLRLRLQVLEQELNEARARLEKGLAQQSEVRQAEMALVEARNQLQLIQTEREARLRSLEVQLRDAEQRSEYVAEMMAVEQALIEARANAVRQGVDEAQIRNIEARVTDAREQAVRAEVAAREGRQVVVDQAVRYALGADEALAGTTAVTDASARVEARDVLVIRISGETALPTAYPVDTAGDIRLPLLGTLQVRGLTVAQVRSAVTDMLADRQLARGATISVSLRRPR